ncbi:MAG: ammonium transporter [Candidatus Nanopelagicales bacterium]|nr:ammonium transporter [Candidatus Nanopelagicales bacterium]MCH9679506.1 ammonium transporter [Actinomycetes bacterium]MBL6833805.1 ammonium transporter [Candidatus Nanopelagicales bacterium]MCH1462254.1 ammonium transporter [Candidatus Nanopelagicales bacterium]MCH9707746.1 ammonium transporter [Actinomycetes bacterium]
MDSGVTAWLLTSAALVFLMIPGLAFFYGGMNRSKSVLNMLMMVVGALFIVGILWAIYGYSMAYGSTAGYFVGNITDYFGLEAALAPPGEGDAFPTMVDVVFQAMFACLTVGLIAGALADRMKFGAWIIFAAIWASLVYFPVAHWVWGGGWIGELSIGDAGVIDFAGGTAVHINAGAAALAVCIILGRRLGWPKTPMRPHNLTMVMLGAGLLWFGWFGFNAGSAYAADNTAAIAATNTLLATCAAGLAWLIVEKIRDKKATSLGAASGIVAGLVAITPACANVTPMGAILLGLVAGAVCAWAVTLKYKLGFDDSFDVVGIHLVGGLVGTLALGFLASDLVEEGGQNGLLYGGDLNLLIVQIIAAVGVMVYSFILAAIIALALRATIGIRSDEEDEVDGIDVAEHAETAYELGDSGAGGAFAGVGHSARAKEVE